MPPCGLLPLTSIHAIGYHQRQSCASPHATPGLLITPPQPQPWPPPLAPQVFEARRFVELRKKSFKEQFNSLESFGMGIFYTMNVFFMQFYLGGWVSGGST